MPDTSAMPQAKQASNAQACEPSTALSTSTDGRTDGLTEKHGHQPDITTTSVTRARARENADPDLHISHTIEAGRVLLHITGPDPHADAHLMTLRFVLGQLCTLAGCGQPRKALGLCQTHYQQHRHVTRNEAHAINRAAKET